MTYVSPTGDTRHYWHRPGTGWLMYMNFAIDVHDLRRVYGSGSQAFEAVRGVDLDVGPAPSTRCWASTAPARPRPLEVIEGLAPATAGEVSVLGLDPIADRAGSAAAPACCCSAAASRAT